MSGELSDVTFIGLFADDAMVIVEPELLWQPAAVATINAANRSCFMCVLLQENEHDSCARASPARARRSCRRSDGRPARRCASLGASFAGGSSQGAGERTAATC